MIRFRSIITRMVALHVVAIGITSILMPLALYWLLNQAANNLHRDALRSQAFTIGSFLRPLYLLEARVNLRKALIDLRKTLIDLRKTLVDSGKTGADFCP